ncbi:hypothetical protein [Pseudoalteromonas denitrificans]|uniref:Porin n=1 Tax=Pseudoalteromonas denitrificans DSM 6059 TaxID=1123010 RepID=A0A1I1NN67_9GAMM|nr:hypothetical protein [Pseudoalteromonas denitrificans]SFC98876.1 hypothetical protein SAMN02745724_03129 [Pseudoalteromonas denitrificans DSM 6059]
MLLKNLAAMILLLSFGATSAEFEVSGKLAVEQRYFFDSALYTEQLRHSQTSILAEPELYWGWNDGNDTVIFKPFYRIDSQDDERTHGDIRELSYIHAGEDWELRTGIRKEFWGVTEFQHLVDVINQTDGVEDTDGEDKLGQLMLNLSLVKDWGIVDLYLLPGFRERTFAGENGRLRAPIVVDENNVSYESSAKEQHLDFAMRWSHSIGDFDLGANWFHGTNREPILTPDQDGDKFVLKQYYNQMDQLGLDVQATIDDWLYKFESIYRNTNDGNFWAIQAGFEYSFVGVFDTIADLGLLMEYSWDSRGEGDLIDPGAGFQNDVFFGSRIAFNDMQSSEFLMGFSTDLDHSATSFIIEANRRLGDSFKASIDVRLFQSSDLIEQTYAIRNDDHVQLSFEWYF